jgi:hypothetical protein
MILRAIPLDFHRQGGYAMPVDRDLHKLAMGFAERELAEVPNFSEFQRVWLACEVDADDRATSVHGALGFTTRPDFTMARFLNRNALVVLYNRASAFLSDNGCRLSEGLVYVNPDEKPEQKCPEAELSLQALGARPANRWLIKIR